MSTNQKLSEQDRQQQIHSAALSAFLLHGYEGASMASIAREIGGSKTTLYSRYPSKRELFLEVLRLEMDRFFANVLNFAPDQHDIKHVIYQHCIDFAKTAQSESTRNLFRLLISECLRLPEVQIDYSMRVDQMIAKLSAALEACVQNKSLQHLDWHSAARLLFDLDMNFLYQQLQERRLFAYTASEQVKHAKAVLDVLLPPLFAARESG